MLSVQVFGPGGHDRNTAPEYFGLTGVAHGPLRRRHSGKGRAVPERRPVDPLLLADQSEGIVMNTTVARSLALGDRVTWAGKNDYQPSGPGTITRITAHQVEVLWEDETARRYRRTQLHNLRHRKLVCELHEARGA
jgi:hypothetical protein